MGFIGAVKLESSIGYGPGDEIHAHTVLDQVKLDDVVNSTLWYGAFPSFVANLK
ncbi:MAG UNVERIFIED_CONTAM: hypothetical protein LVT10_12225 [Anaerolineae bacterium]|jgi:hypothetical protein